MNKKEVTGMICAALSAILFGSESLVINAAYDLGSNPLMVTFGRFLIGTALLGLILLILPSGSFRVTKKQFFKLIPLSVFLCGTPMLLYSAYQFIGVGLSTTLHFTYPILVMALSALLFRVKPTKKDLFCGVLCMAGIVLLSQAEGSLNGWGVFIALLSGLVYASYAVFLDRSGLRVLNVLTVSFWLSLLSAVIVFLAAAVTGKLAFSLPGQFWIYYALLALIAMVLGATLLQVGVRLCGPVRATLFSTLEPVTAVIVGLLAFHEILQRRMILGIVLILLAVLVLALPGRKEAEPRVEEDRAGKE